MSPWWGHFTGIIIVLMMMVFIAIWIWAWRPRHQRAFAALASLPMADAVPSLGSPASAANVLPEEDDMKGASS